jgi:hypothetical protein
MIAAEQPEHDRGDGDRTVDGSSNQVTALARQQDAKNSSGPRTTTSGIRKRLPQGSMRIESRIASRSARSSAGEPTDASAAIIRRVPSTSRIQNSST